MKVNKNNSYNLYVYIYTYIQTYIYTHIHIYEYIYIYIYIHTYILIYTFTYIHRYVYIYIHAYIYIYKHLHFLLLNIGCIQHTLNQAVPAMQPRCVILQRSKFLSQVHLGTQQPPKRNLKKHHGCECLGDLFLNITKFMVV